MGFVGVTTGQSSIRRVFPAWARVLGLPAAELVGYDLPPGAEPQRYREVVAAIRDDERCAGALITTHKIGVFQAARDMLDGVDEFAEVCGEISSLSKRDGRLIGHAKDPITAGMSLEEFLTPDYFARTGGHVLCLGDGGAGTAIAWYLSRRADAPEQIICTGRSQQRLDEMMSALRGAGRSRIRPVLVDGPSDALLADQPDGSLVINATGLGKDTPGSPVTEAASWPRNGIAWELNYRGTLEFLHQARAAATRADLTVVDGWRYFIHGWTQVIAEVFELELSRGTIEDLAAVAESVR